MEFLNAFNESLSGVVLVAGAIMVLVFGLMALFGLWIVLVVFVLNPIYHALAGKNMSLYEDFMNIPVDRPGRNNRVN